MSRRTARAISILGAVLYLSGCGSKTDLVVLEVRCEDSQPGTTWSPMIGSTWIAMAGSGALAVTELLTLQPRPGALSSSWRPDIAMTRIEGDGSVETWTGRVVSEEGDQFVVAPEHRHTLEMQPELAVLARSGSDREDVSMDDARILRVNADGSSIQFTDGDSAPMSFFSLFEMIRRIDETVGFHTQAGAEAAAQLVRLPMFTSRVRVVGWGSGGMTQYMYSEAAFVGLTTSGPAPNELGVIVTGGLISPRTDYDFRELQDQHGILLDGLHWTETDLLGNGEQHGRVSFRIDSAPCGESRAVVGEFDFEELTMVDGYEGPGTAHITIEGETFAIADEVLFHLDFSPYLPAP